MEPLFVTKPSERAQEIASDVQALLKNRPGAARDVVFAIGGDGTMLRAITEHYRPEALFVGISAGHLGFLQAVEADQLVQLVGTLAAGGAPCVTMPMLAVRTDKKVLGYAFNDISVERSDARAARFQLDVDGSTGSFIGDGVLFATPLGSTAYSLAAGGPIVDSRLPDVFVVTPNNPHVSLQYSSLQRPHVLAGTRRVTIIPHADGDDRRSAKLVLDGQTVLDPLEERVTIYLSDRNVRILQLEQDGFHNRIEQKRLGRN